MDDCEGRVTDSRHKHWMDEGVGERQVRAGPSCVCGCGIWKRELDSVNDGRAITKVQ